MLTYMCSILFSLNEKSWVDFPGREFQTRKLTSKEPERSLWVDLELTRMLTF